ncbi:50S ribosomal protein L22 [bacterium endosymbiont of Pedicinus badii]|uniref:50S ribosomal protein L22 n=1 Tax=bacterium endosymbiont of Pedicinus badii TaxID=1719126 RepID=UPI0009BC12EC|nr:50S ribosomal protein L22 [bacterium endosymbiont of Pedicinus badii]OQM34105.1 50S ribosomal protein L22 [bacterium endosymbiont of Pedicinus badii]
MKEILAKHLYAKSSAQKIRLIANLIKGKKAILALQILQFSKKKSAFLLYKVLKSAIANSENNYGILPKYLFIKKVFIDKAVSMKRIMPRAKGKADRILKRTSHITLILSSKQR